MLRVVVFAVAVALAVTALVIGPGGCSRPAQSQPAPDEGERSRVAMSQKALDNNPVEIGRVQRTRLAVDLEMVGSVSYDQDHVAVIGPLVPGRVHRLRAGLGDQVKAGTVLAEIESTVVGEAQAQYLGAAARAQAADANLRRERDLAAQRISSEREREVAEAQSAQESAEMRAAIEKLRAYGLGPEDIEAMRRGTTSAGRVPMRSPIAGTVVQRTITLGQAVERATDAFKVVNLSKLWVLLDLYEKDLNRVHVGQRAEVRTEAYPGEIWKARVAYVTPIIDDKTRTATVRIEFDNPSGKLRPGQFVTAKLIGDPANNAREVLAVPRKAVVTVQGKSMVFVKTASGFERRVVELGASGGTEVEVAHGVRDNEEIAIDGAFLLKAELLR